MAMQKAEEIIDHLMSVLQTSKPKTSVEWRLDPSLPCEKVHVDYAGGIMRIEAGSERGLVYGLQQVIVGWKSGHSGEFLGELEPLYSLRPLWLGSDHVVKLNEFLSLGLSKQSIEQTQQLCLTCVSMGYNAVVIGSREGIIDEGEYGECPDVVALIDIFHSYGIKVYLKPQLIVPKKCESYCPLDRQFRNYLHKAFSSLDLSVDGYFWESALLYPEFQLHVKAKDLTLAELVQAEVHIIEDIIGKETSLLFYVPTLDSVTAQHHASWLAEFCDDVGNHTMIAFPAAAGPLTCDHVAAHPFWDVLRRLPDVSATRLLPIINSGAVEQGEGLWPSPPFDLIRYYLSRCYRHHFAGVIGVVNQVPENKGLLHMCLFVAGQAMWHKRDPYLLAETWCAAYRPDWNLAHDAEALCKVRSLVKELSKLRTQAEDNSQEEGRCHAESILAQLNQLERAFDRHHRSEDTSFHDYFIYFSQDARHILSHALQKCNVSLSNVLQENKTKGCFWTKRQSGGFTFLGQPNRGNPGSKMEKIFCENRID